MKDIYVTKALEIYTVEATPTKIVKGCRDRTGWASIIMRLGDFGEVHHDMSAADLMELSKEFAEAAKALGAE